MSRTLAGLGIAMGIALALLGAPAHAAAPADPDRVVGLWFTEERDAQVRVEKVDGSYQGTIVWLKEPQYPADDDQGMAGQTKVDRENPVAAHQHDPILGLTIVKGFSFDADDDEWNHGTIYDPNNGKTYKCRMWFDGETLRVRGYIGFSLLGRSTTWTRVATPAP